MVVDNEILSIEYDDDNKNYESFTEYLNDDTNRKKKKIATEFDVMGKQLVKEIEANKNRQIVQKYQLIPYILKHSKNKYTEDDLLEYSIDDVRDIYKEVKKENSSKFDKFIKFIFNL